MKKIYKYIKNLLFPKEFDHNPENFKLKAEASWFGGGFYDVMYTANGGLNWKHLLEVRPPLFEHSLRTLYEYNWEWANQTFKPAEKSLESYRKQFKCYQDILDFYEREEKRLIEGKQQRRDKIKQLEEEISKNLQ